MALNQLFLLSLILFSIHSNFIFKRQEYSIFYYLKKFFSGVDLFYNVVCYFQVYNKVNYMYISCVYTYIHSFLFLLDSFSHIGHCSVPSRVPRALSQVLIIYLSYVRVCTCQFQSPNLSLPPIPFNFKFVFHICDSTSVLQIRSLALFFFFFFFQIPCVSDITQHLSFSLTYFTQYGPSRSIYATANGIVLFFFRAELKK